MKKMTKTYHAHDEPIIIIIICTSRCLLQNHVEQEHEFAHQPYDFIRFLHLPSSSPSSPATVHIHPNNASSRQRDCAAARPMPTAPRNCGKHRRRRSEYYDHMMIRVCLYAYYHQNVLKVSVMFCSLSSLACLSLSFDVGLHLLSVWSLLLFSCFVIFWIVLYFVCLPWLSSLSLSCLNSS